MSIDRFVDGNEDSMFNYDESSEEVTYVELTHQSVVNLADELEKLSVRMRELARLFKSPMSDRVAVDVAANIVDEYVQKTGSLGGRLSVIVHNAGYVDRDLK